jgi:hypothetical protein
LCDAGAVCYVLEPSSQSALPQKGTETQHVHFLRPFTMEKSLIADARNLCGYSFSLSARAFIALRVR